MLAHSLAALRRLPADQRPKRVLGCEVWRDLDWLVDADKQVLDAGRFPNLTVVDVGEDRVYGRFILLDHGAGFRTLYAHASTTFAERGQRVLRDEVIALSGSTGRSTAPHLHFEILLNGEPVDPLTLVKQP